MINEKLEINGLTSNDPLEATIEMNGKGDLFQKG
jgi:hypothetical protein